MDVYRTGLPKWQRVRAVNSIKRVVVGVVASTLVTALVLQAAPSASHASDSSTLIVKLRDAAVVASAATGTGGRVVDHVGPQTAVVEVPATALDTVIAQLGQRSDVEWVEPNIEYRALDVPNDPCYVATCYSGASQWYGDAIGAPSAWSVSKSDTSIKIAVIDSGVDVGHPELSGHVTVGPNFSADATNLDEYGHGTHVAGVLGAATDNGSGMAGMVWNSSMVSVKVLNSSGVGGVAGVANGIRWAADNGVRIANLSLGGSPSTVVAEAVTYAQARGVLIVAAAGNDGVNSPIYPAAYTGVISVGASDGTGNIADEVSWGSNWGTWVDLLAPGVNIVSTWPRNLDSGNPYRVLSGTSMATPIAAGVAALLWSERPYMSTTEVHAQLMRTAQSMAGSGTVTASGLLRADAALTQLPYGYRLVAADGGIFSYDQPFHGSTGSMQLNDPIVTGMTAGDQDGYWLIARDGGVFTFGTAGFYGSTGGIALNQPIVGAAASRSGLGYWLVASDGGVFAFGDAQFYGSTGSLKLNSPIVAVVPTATGRGYWLVASDGGVFSFGDAQFHGSTGSLKLNSSIVTAARTSLGNGYWLVASDGGVFSFGDAQFHGSTGSLKLNRPIVGMSPSPTGHGYWLVASDGGVFSFGDATFLGSTGSIKLNRPVVTIVS